MSKGSPRETFRLSRQEDLAIRLLARRANKPVGEYIRLAMKEHLRGVSDTQTLGGRHLEALTNLTKQYITSAQLSLQASKVPMKESKEPGLPGSPKRDDLEALVWKAIQEAVSYSKTEAAAKDAEARLLALRVANGLMRTELALLKHQDDAFVGALLEELGADANGLATKTRKES